MKKIYVIVLIILLLGCDTFEEARIVNKTNKVVQFISIGNPVDIINGHAELINQVGEKYIYRLKPYKSDAILQLINKDITPRNIYFDTLIIVRCLDTISFNGRQEIFEAMEKVSKRTYEIIIE